MNWTRDSRKKKIEERGRELTKPVSGQRERKGRSGQRG